MADLHLLGISGSLRKESYNTAILRTIRDRVAPQIAIAIFDIGRLPHYNQDVDGEMAPDIVRQFRAQIAAAHGLVIVSPEYNYGIPGVLKNAIDWASRPAFRSVLVGKKVVFMTASIATTGGVRAQAQIREALLSALAEVVNGPEVAIASAHEKVRDGRLVDEAAVNAALAAVKRLVERVRMPEAAPV